MRRTGTTERPIATSGRLGSAACGASFGLGPAGQNAMPNGRSRLAANTLTVGTVAAFLQFVRRFFQPLQDLSEKYNILQGAMASSERIFTLLDTPAALDTAQPTPQISRLMASGPMRPPGRAVASRGGGSAVGGGCASNAPSKPPAASSPPCSPSRSPR